jgi:hypothetical protein
MGASLFQQKEDKSMLEMETTREQETPRHYADVVETELAFRYPVRVSLTGLEFERNLEPGEWRELTQALLRLGRGCQWWLGDALLQGESRYGDKCLDLVDITGYARKTLQNYASVCRRFERSRRRERLPFAHHAELQGYTDEEQEKWLDSVEQNGWSREELRQQLKALSPPFEEEKAALPVASGIDSFFGAAAEQALRQVAEEREATPVLQTFDRIDRIDRIAEEREATPEQAAAEVREVDVETYAQLHASYSAHTIGQGLILGYAIVGNPLSTSARLYVAMARLTNSLACWRLRPHQIGEEKISVAQKRARDESGYEGVFASHGGMGYVLTGPPVVFVCRERPAPWAPSTTVPSAAPAHSPVDAIVLEREAPETRAEEEGADSSPAAVVVSGALSAFSDTTRLSIVSSLKGALAFLYAAFDTLPADWQAHYSEVYQDIREAITEWRADLEELAETEGKKKEEVATPNDRDAEDPTWKANPFARFSFGHWSQTCDAADRMEAVKGFSVAQLRQALALPDLQKTVRERAEARLRKLEKETASERITDL